MNFGAMAPGEWAKINSQTKVGRIDILKQIIKSGEALPKTDGVEVVIRNTPENRAAVDRLEKEKKTQEFITNKGPIKSNEIGKSNVFGGATGGSGGGTQQTASAEIAQCMYCEFMINNTKASFESIQPSDLQKAYNATFVKGASFDQVMKLDPSWHWSGYWTAKELLKRNLINKNMTFHRDDKVMNDIYKVKDLALKNSQMNKLSNDKWNPGDIWATVDKSIASKLPKGSIQELNQELVKLFNNRRLVGISLKKVQSAKGIKVSIENKDESLDVHKFKSGRLMATFARKGAEFWRGKAANIEFDGGKAAIRNKSQFAALTFELELKTARGGGGGYTQILDSIKRRVGKTLPTNPELKKMALELNKLGEKSRYALPIYNMVKKIHPTVTKQEFMQGLTEKLANEVHSKIASIYVLFELVNNAKNGKADLIVTDMVNYAGSKLDISSIYAKVYE
tara:strand:- start:1558 stop:2913 length:1356 start_codon:yes stop_codon:yes gene_type:complete